MNRDPLGEPGFERLRSAQVSLPRQRTIGSPYHFVANNPNSSVDAWGLRALDKIPGLITDFGCPAVAQKFGETACKVCCSLAFQASLAALNYEVSLLLIACEGASAGWATVGCVSGALADLAVSTAQAIKAYKGCLDDCKTSCPAK